MACLNRAKHCPGEAVKIVNLPSNLETNVTHHYSMNAFKLHGLPTPRPGTVLGLLGSNGTGKSTALNILSGRLKPNLGNFTDPPHWMQIYQYYRGSELQNYFARYLQEDITVAIKVQLDNDFIRKLIGQKVGATIQQNDQRDAWEEIATKLDLMHLLDREVQSLSGGELQRFAIACTAVRDADVYMFDEASSFLDARQRMTAVDLIRGLTVNEKQLAAGSAKANKHVIVVEHDLTVLDYISDYVCCLYGEPSAYGVVTKVASVRNGINNFLAGYIPAENMRFRAESLTFCVSGADGASDQIANEGGAGKASIGTVNYPAMSKTLTQEKDGVTSSFTLNIEAGALRGTEIIGLLGENGCGKTTFMELLSGSFEKAEKKAEAKAEKAEGEAAPAKAAAPPAAERTPAKAGAGEKEKKDAPPPDHTLDSIDALASLGVAYKRQNYAPRLRKFTGTVQELLEKCINAACADRFFRLLVLRPLQMEALEQCMVKNLSGGELQRVAICLCLGTPANVYLLDEPSAALDCEQRVIAAKVIRRWIINHKMKTAFVVEHDFVMASALADRVIVYRGQPGIECTATPPQSLATGFNEFLKHLDVTFRRDPNNFRPRVNKKNSAKDKEQKKSGNYFVFDAEDDDEDDKPGKGKGGKKGGN
jgi:ATP-binding cassette subfamily E protein 1